MSTLSSSVLSARCLTPKSTADNYASPFKSCIISDTLARFLDKSGAGLAAAVDIFFCAGFDFVTAVGFLVSFGFRDFKSFRDFWDLTEGCVCVDWKLSETETTGCTRYLFLAR